MENNNSKDQKREGEKPSRMQEQNQSLKDPGAAVADYGRTGEGTERLTGENSRGSESPIPLGKEDTIGNH